jgi:hypothetical protein
MGRPAAEKQGWPPSKGQGWPPLSRKGWPAFGGQGPLTGPETCWTASPLTVPLGGRGTLNSITARGSLIGKSGTATTAAFAALLASCLFLLCSTPHQQAHLHSSQPLHCFPHGVHDLLVIMLICSYRDCLMNWAVLAAPRSFISFWLCSSYARNLSWSSSMV